MRKEPCFKSYCLTSEGGTGQCQENSCRGQCIGRNKICTDIKSYLPERALSGTKPHSRVYLITVRKFNMNEMYKFVHLTFKFLPYSYSEVTVLLELVLLSSYVINNSFKWFFNWWRWMSLACFDVFVLLSAAFCYGMITCKK